PTERRWSWWGRVIFYDADVDALYERALAAGCRDADGESVSSTLTPTATNLVSHALCGPRCDSHEIGYSLSQLHPMRMRLPLERRRSAAYWRSSGAIYQRSRHSFAPGDRDYAATAKHALVHFSRNNKNDA